MEIWQGTAGSRFGADTRASVVNFAAPHAPIYRRKRIAAFGGYDRLTSKINFEVNRSSGMDVVPTNNHRESGVGFTQRSWVNPKAPRFYLGFTLPCDLKSDYRGEMKIIMINLGSDVFQIARGDRIAQLVPALVQRAVFAEVADLDETVRGAGGFGSTGVKALQD